MSSGLNVFCPLNPPYISFLYSEAWHMDWFSFLTNLVLRDCDFLLSLQEHRLSCRLCFLPACWLPPFPVCPARDLYSWGPNSKYSPSLVLLDPHTLLTLSGKIEPQMKATTYFLCTLFTAGQLKATRGSCIFLHVGANASLECSLTLYLPLTRVHSLLPQIQAQGFTTLLKTPTQRPPLTVSTRPHALLHCDDTSSTLISVNFPSPFRFCLI